MISFIVPQFIKNYLKKYYISKKYSVTLEKNVKVSTNSVLEGESIINENCNIQDSFIGLGTYIASDSFMPVTKIGRFCSIGQNVRTCLGRHPTSKFVSSHPSFWLKSKLSGFTFVNENKFEPHLYIDSTNKYSVEIGNDVWIGNNVMIIDGTKIGDGAIVGLGSIVTKDIEPYSINVGIPAKKIKYRFEKKYIEFLLEFKWWDKDFEWLNENAYLFDDIKEFYRKFGPNANNND